MTFSLVSTIYNEAKRLQQTIADLKAQTLHPSEIIITDAGSTDGSYEKLLQWKSESAIPITILQKPDCNVAEGRNLAIRSAKYDIIASTDFGCRFHPEWLDSLISPFRDNAVKAMGGAYAVIEDEVKTLAAKAAYILSNGYNVDVYAPWFIPSSRSIAFRKEVFNKVGGYPEWLTLAGDDMVFGKEVLANGYSFHLVNKPYVFWERHTSKKAYCKESARYGLGDGEARLAPGRVLFKSLELVSRISIIILFPLYLLITNSISFWIVLVAIFVLILSMKSYFYYLRMWMKYKSHKYNLIVLLYGFYFLDATRLSYTKAYMHGYFKSTANQKKQAALLHYRLHTS